MSDCHHKNEDIESFHRYASCLKIDAETLAKTLLDSAIRQYIDMCKALNTDQDIENPEDHFMYDFKEPYLASFIEGERKANAKWSERISFILTDVYDQLKFYFDIDELCLKEQASNKSISIDDTKWLNKYLQKVPIITLFDITDLDIYFSTRSKNDHKVYINKMLMTIMEIVLAPQICDAVFAWDQDGTKIQFQLNFDLPTIEVFVNNIVKATDAHLEPHQFILKRGNFVTLHPEFRPLSFPIFNGMKEFALLHEYAHYLLHIDASNKSDFEQELDADTLAANAFVHYCFKDPMLEDSDRNLGILKLSAPFIFLLYLSVIQARYGFKTPDSHPSPFARLMLLQHIIVNAVSGYNGYSRGLVYLVFYLTRLFGQVLNLLGLNPEISITPANTIHDYPIVCYPPGAKSPSVFSLCNPDFRGSQAEMKAKSDAYCEKVLRKKKEAANPGDEVYFGFMNNSLVFQYTNELLNNLQNSRSSKICF